MNMQENRPKPFSKERTKATICKILFFYSVFFIVMKIMAVFNGYPLKASLVLSLPFLVLALWGLFQVKKNSYSWLYLILGILIVSAIRYYEIMIYDYLITG